MAEIIILEAGNTFIMKMSEEDMVRICDIASAKKTNCFDTVLAAFHCGLVTLTTHLQRHKQHLGAH